MSYQSVLRNSSNALLVNTAVGIKISVLQGSESGAAVYVETQTATTNANGLVSLQIGLGTATTGSFADIDWSAGPYFIKTETDPAGGTNYSITGTQEILSVPYAMYAAKSGESSALQAQITDLQAQITTLRAPIVTPIIGSYTYTGSPQGPTTATNTGTGTTYTFSYTGVSPTVYATSATPPINAGSYTVTATVAAVGGNYFSASSPPTAFTIAKASPTVTPIIGSYTYTGSPQGPTTATNTGIGTTYTFSYTGVSPTVYATSATPPTTAGSYTVTATVAAVGGNYFSASSAPTTFIIFYAIGQSALGGKIAYILQPGDPGYDANLQHGLVVSTDDLRLSFWGQMIYIDNGNGPLPTTFGGTQSEIGTGATNTTRIIARWNEHVLSGGLVYYGVDHAAKIARDYRGGGYDDWFLPSLGEFEKIGPNKIIIGGGAFGNPNFYSEIGVRFYLTSTEGNYFCAYVHELNFSYCASKEEHYAIVRAARAF